MGSESKNLNLFKKGDFLRPEDSPGPAVYESKGFVDYNKNH